MRALLLAIALVLAFPEVATAQGRVELRFADCQPAEVEIGALIAPIQPSWAPYVQRCPIRDPRGRIVLSILTVRVDLVGSEGEAAPFPIPFPNALVLDARNRPIGELAGAVPGGPPGTTIVAFSDWRGDFPHRIDVREINAAVKATYNKTPLFWNSTRRRYEER